MSATDAPVGGTEASVSVTGTRVSETRGPVNATETPVSETPGPVGATDTPVSETPGPVGATDTPVSETPGPVGATDTPVSETPGPVSATVTRLGETDGPLSVTDALHGVTSEAVRAFVSRAETRRMLMSIVAGKVPQENVRGQAVGGADASAAPTPARSDSSPGTSKHASWLNQIECAELRAAVYDSLLWFNAQSAPPFRWTYRPKSWAS